MRRWSGTLLILCLGLVGVVSGATLRHAEDAKDLAEKILARAALDDIDSIVNVVKPYWSFPDEELDALVARTAQQRRQLLPRLGKSLGYTLVRREFAAETLLRLTYLERFEHTGLRWLFIFYKSGKDSWKFQQFTWDEDLSKVFPGSK